MADPVQKHIVAFAYQAWGTSFSKDHSIRCSDAHPAARWSSGHARPLTILVSRFVKLHPVQITLLSHDAFFERIQTELLRCFEPGEQEYANRIRQARLTMRPAAPATPLLITARAMFR